MGTPRRCDLRQPIVVFLLCCSAALGSDKADIGAHITNVAPAHPTLWDLLNWVANTSTAPFLCQGIAHTLQSAPCLACQRAAGGEHVFSTGGLAPYTACGQCVRRPAMEICRQCLTQIDPPRLYPSVDEGYLNGLYRTLPIRADIRCGAWPAEQGWGCCHYSDPGCNDTGTGAEAYLAWSAYPDEFPKAALGVAALPVSSNEECASACEKLVHYSWPPSLACCYRSPVGCFVKPAARASSGPGNANLFSAVDCMPQPLGMSVDELNTVTSVTEGSAADRAGLRPGHRILYVDLAPAGTFYLGGDGCPGCCPPQKNCASLDQLMAPVPTALQGLAPPHNRGPGLSDWAFVPNPQALQTDLHIEVSSCAACINALPMPDIIVSRCLAHLPLNPSCIDCVKSLGPAPVDCQVCHQTGTRCDACLTTLLDFTAECKACWDTLGESFPSGSCAPFATIAPSCEPCLADLAASTGDDSHCHRCLNASEGLHCDKCWKDLPTHSHHCQACQSQMPSASAFGACARNVPISSECSYCLALLPGLDSSCAVCARSGQRAACAACWAKARRLNIYCEQCMPRFPSYFVTDPCRQGTDCMSLLGRQFLWVSFIVIFAAAMYFLQGVLLRSGGRGTYFPFLIVTSCTVSALVYLVLCSGMGIFTVGNAEFGEGREVYWARFVDWAITMPLQLTCLCRLAGAKGGTQRQLVALIVVSVGAALCASLSTASGSHIRLGFTSVALLTFLAVVYDMLFKLRRAANRQYEETCSMLYEVLRRQKDAFESRGYVMSPTVLSPGKGSVLSDSMPISPGCQSICSTGTRYDEATLEEANEEFESRRDSLSLYVRLAWFTIGTFALYPVVWVLRSMQVINLDIEAIVFCVLDLNMKVLFGLSVMRVQDRVDNIGREGAGGRSRLKSMRQCACCLWPCLLQPPSKIPAGPAKHAGGYGTLPDADALPDRLRAVY
eukprot:TRINITY_DN22725_c1_g1_i1.p1 TRINITY_DN22725_c1_g1~~TRINITY_DN22725_c1_g1_i1.p1  ORF type:complete len:974 (+),score=205.51 TRINITY_DN22725_c1_g1_i1:69-2924(+)